MSKEILMVVDAVSNEKGVEKDIIFEAIEAALASATARRHAEDIAVRVAIDREDGSYETFRRWLVFADDSTELEVPDHDSVALLRKRRSRSSCKKYARLSVSRWSRNTKAAKVK